MKNLFTRLMLVAVAAMSIVACQTEPVIYVPEVNTFDMTIIADGDTRTELDGTSINWSAGDKLSVVVNNSIKTSNALDSATTTASFTVEDVATSNTGYTIQAVYPADANKEARGADYPNVYRILTATEQTPSTTSFDGAADMLVAKEVTTEQPSELNMQFTRLVALGKMTLTEFTPESAIKSVTFSTSDTALTGRSYVNLSTTEVEYGYTNQAFKNVVLNYVGTEDWSNGYTIYFTCFPAELTTDFTVVVETVDGTKYTKTVTLNDKTLSFTAGDMTRFKVKMDDAEVKEPSALTTYNLLTDIYELTAGDKIIIAATNSDVALSTTQNGNNRGATEITKGDGTVTFGDDVQIFSVEIGTQAGTFAFNTGSGYLYAASASNNYLRTETTLSDNSSWKIEISGGPDYSASIVAQGTNTRNQLRYNSSSSIFSCYASGQQDVAIYYLNGKEPDYMKVSTDTISFTAEGGEETFTVSKNFEAEESVTCDNDLFAITGGNGSYTVTARKNETTEEITGTITVTAGEFTKTIAVTQKAVPVEAEAITIAEFIEKADTTTEYKLTGTISNVVNTTYGNFDLTDASGKIYVYGLSSPEGEDKYWSKAGVKAGDVITIQGTYTLYNNTTNEVVNAKYVSHYGVTAEKTSVEIDANGGESTIAISLVNTDEAITATSDNAHFSASIDGDNLVISADANETEAAITGTITIKAGDAYTEINVSQAALSTGGDTIILIDEEFDNTTTADSSSAISTSKFPNFSGATEKAYTSKYGGIKLGTGSVVGYITSKSLDLSKAFTVTLDACKYGSDTGDIVVTVDGVKQTIANSELGAAGSFKTFTLTFDAATATSTVKIATSSKRAYIDNVKIAYTE